MRWVCCGKGVRRERAPLEEVRRRCCGGLAVLVGLGGEDRGRKEEGRREIVEG